jgi:RNA polymerase sigma-70 factor, ECF subfamily
MAAEDKKLAVELSAMYGDLKRLARGQMRRERDDHTLSATGLVHEAYLKLASSHVEWQDKNHFLGIASRAMRQILVNHALAHRTEKRGGDWLKLTLTSATPEIEASPDDAEEIVGLDEALKALEAVDERQGSIVELRYFGGLSIEETAAALALSPATVKREWALARAFLRRAMAETNSKTT